MRHDIRTYSVLIALTLIAGLLPACVGTRPGHGKVAITALPPAPAVAPEQPTPWTLDISNDRGTIAVKIDPEARQPLVLAETPGVRNAADPAGCVAAEAIINDSSHLLRIAAKAPEGVDLPVQLKITLPASNGVHIRSSGGFISLVGVAGVMDIESGGAAGPGSPIYIVTDAALTQGVRAITSRGDIKIRMGEASSGLVDARGTHAAVTTPPGAIVTNVRQNATTFAAHIGASESMIEVKAANGAVDVRFDQRSPENAKASTKGAGKPVTVKRK